eukprot:CAMPEP_0114271174 /NCGR_PEP_ID=MMETSP0058-20121206/27697_1 /TAXON_ID=36894 /ORGANISM="Pyramimonas parkeae, CCMP726" /LENGTH=48 /DNA_ID= /DNA_START= /DNA_END= /DNA_ORIENTATION=
MKYAALYFPAQCLKDDSGPSTTGLAFRLNVKFLFTLLMHMKGILPTTD